MAVRGDDWQTKFDGNTNEHNGEAKRCCVYCRQEIMETHQRCCPNE